MKLSPEQYEKLYLPLCPKTNTLRNCSLAFLIGGALCLLGELLKTLYSENPALEEDEVGMLVSASLIVLAALATGLGFYDKLARVAGAGSLVPITGFANAVVSPALEFTTEGFIFGTAAKIFSIAGPVIVYGTASAALAGFIYWVINYAI